MGVVTLSREYGSDGRALARLAAEKLGYLCMDKELIQEVARRAQVPVAEVERYDEQPEHPLVRALRKFLAPGHQDALTGLSDYEWWAASTAPDLAGQEEQDLAVLDEETYVRLAQEVILRLADRGNVIVVGRGGQALLAHRIGVTHVRITAPLEYRIRTTMRNDNLDRAAALARIRRVDAKRRRYVKRYHGVAWEAPEQYHLVLNTERLGLAGAVDLVVEAVRRLPAVRPAWKPAPGRKSDRISLGEIPGRGAGDGG